MTGASRTARRRQDRIKAVSWSDPSTIDVEPAVVTRALVSVLRSLPAAGSEAPGAVRTAGPARTELAQTEKPISYLELDDHWIFDGLDPDRSAGIAAAPPNVGMKTALEEAVEKLAAGRQRQVSPHHGGAREGAGVNRKRPGRGGRQPRATGAAISSLSAPIRERWGQPESVVVRSVTMEVFRHQLADGALIVGANGPGGILGRMSTREINEGETMMSQVQPLLRFCEQHQLEPAVTILTYNNGGGQAAEDRIDFAELERGIRAGEINWVVIRDVDRLVRNDLAKAKIFDLMQRTGTDLYIAGWGRKVDWERDHIHLHTEALFGEHERMEIKRRTQTAIESRFIAEGRGSPGQARFGFYRDENRDLRVDAEQWPFIRFIHYRYAELDGKHGSLRQIQKELAAQGCEFSPSHIARMLRDPIYVTGEATTWRRGRLVTLKPIPLSDPIPADLYQRNLERLNLIKGKNSATPVGWYLLNGVEFVHQACADELVDNNSKGLRRAFVRGAGRKDGPTPRPSYVHSPRVPECCKGWSLDSVAVDRAVARELRRLARNRALQEEWANAPRFNSAKAIPVLDEDSIEQLEISLRRLQAEREELAERLVDRIEAGEKVTEQDYLELAGGPISRRMSTLKRRIEVARAMPIQAINPAQGAASSPLCDVAWAGEIDPTEEANLLAAFGEILTDERPDDPEQMRRRAALIQACLSRVTVVDVEEEPGAVQLILEGPLVPEGSHLTSPISPIDSAKEVICVPDEPLSKSTPSQRFDRGDQPLSYDEFRDCLFDLDATSSRAHRQATVTPRKRRGTPAWIGAPVLLRRARRPNRVSTFEDCLRALRWTRTQLPNDLPLTRKRHDEAVKQQRVPLLRSEAIRAIGKERDLTWQEMCELAFGDMGAGKE